MKTLTNISFTTHGRDTAGAYLRELDDTAPDFSPIFIKRLEHEFKSTESITHQMLNAGDVIRVIETIKHDLRN